MKSALSIRLQHRVSVRRAVVMVALPVEILAERAVGEAEPLAHLGMRNRLYLVVERLQGDAQHVCRFPGTKVFLLEHPALLHEGEKLLGDHSCFSSIHGSILLRGE